MYPLSLRACSRSVASFFECASAGVISVGSVVAVDVVRIEIIARVFWWQIYVSELLKILSCSRDGDGDYTYHSGA